LNVAVDEDLYEGEEVEIEFVVMMMENLDELTAIKSL
jgi:hypothetical protein